jgi:phosphoserine aminotransferase
LTKKGKLIKGIFEGETINTPSMLCVEDYIDALSWVEQQGGQHGIMKKTNENLAVLTSFVNTNPWMTFLAKDESSRSNTSVCLQLDLPKPKIKEFTTLLEKEGVAFDIGSYRDAPPGLRIWCGATVNKEDLEVLMPWLKWAYTQVA